MENDLGRIRLSYEADSLGIPGVGIPYEHLGPASGIVFQVRGAAALDELRAALRGRYRIVVWGVHYCTYMEIRSLPEAERLIKEARQRSDSSH